jgi:hypothetical protein
MSLKIRHKSFMITPMTGINAPGQVSFQSDGIMDGLADGLLDGLREGLLDGSGDIGTTPTGQVTAASAAVVPITRQQQKRLTPPVELHNNVAPATAYLQLLLFMN